MLKFMLFPSFLKILTCVYCLNYTGNNLGKKLLELEIRISGRLIFQAELSRGRLELLNWLTEAVFTPNVNYIQPNYDSIYHTLFDFIQLCFCSYLRKLK